MSVLNNSYSQWTMRVLVADSTSGTNGRPAGTNTATYISGSGHDIYNSSTKSYRVAEKQLSVIGADKNVLKGYQMQLPTDGNSTTPGFAKVSIVQGTADSADASALKGFGFELRYLDTLPLDRNKPFALNTADGTTVAEPSTADTYTWGHLPAMGTHSAVALSGLNAFPELQYQFYINVTGPRIREVNSEETADGYAISFTSPASYDTAGGDAAEISNLYLNLAHNANLNSMALTNVPLGHGNAPYVVFAIDPAGTGTGTTFADIISGTATSIDFQKRYLAGATVTDSIAVTAELRETFARLVIDGLYPTALTESAKVIPVDILDTTARVTSLLFVALDFPKGKLYDEPSDRKNTITLSGPTYTEFTRAFTRVVKAFEGQGKGSTYLQMYKDKHLPDLYLSQRWGSNFNFIQMPSYIDENTYYTSYVIETEFDTEGTSIENSKFGQQIVMLVPATRTAPTVSLVDGNTTLTSADVTASVFTTATTKQGTITEIARWLGSIPKKTASISHIQVR